MRFLAVLLVLLLLVAGAAAWLLYLPVTPRGDTFVDITPGTGTATIARQLQDAHVIPNRYAFFLLRIWKGGSLKAGEYRFDTPASAQTVYARIVRGDVYTIALTIPEGFNIFDIANAVQTAGLGSRDAFLQAARTNTSLIAEWQPAATSLEGYLYPDTYRFPRHITPLQIQATMVRRFRKEVATLGLANPGNCAGLCSSVAQTVTLASLVEKEVHFDDERALAAGVFINRLNRNMPLQTDPTVIYAAELAGRWTGSIHRVDLDFSSPYNTYRNPGLPPGPICSPGAAALRAAVHPAATDALYFVADNAGHTRFSAGLAEHASQVADYYKGRQPQ